MRLIFSAALALALGACQSTAPRPTLAFDAKAAGFINHEGTTRIDGHAFFRSETGRVIFAAGENVWLIPRTPYSDRRFAELYGNAKYARAKGLPSIAADPAYVKYTRSTKAESNGRFTFDHVAPGEYYVATSVTWKPASSFLTRGGAIYERVAVTGKEKEPIRLIVSGR